MKKSILLFTVLLLVSFGVFPVNGQNKDEKVSVGKDNRGDPPYLLESGWIPMLNGKNMADAETIYAKTLSVTDSSGVWSEYYNNHLLQGTRYGPCESAINIEALLKFANQYDISVHKR